MLIVLLQFQFHKGTIRTIMTSKPSAILITNFNSIKVRLEPAGLNPYLMMNGFQFHKGTIRTLKILLKVIIYALFQFHKGTIRTTLYALTFLAILNFNSIKVRLEPAGLNPYLMMQKFQFHKGTIRTHCLGIYNILIFNRIRGCKVNKSY